MHTMRRQDVRMPNEPGLIDEPLTRKEYDEGMAEYSRLMSASAEAEHKHDYTTAIARSKEAIELMDYMLARLELE